MDEQQEIDFGRIAAAIEFLYREYKKQPSLEEAAREVHLSPDHFQRMFTNWAGVSPKKFVQYLTVSHAKSVLDGKQPTLFDVAHETGLSGTGRLHDLFVKIEAMTPGEYKNGGKSLSIFYQEINTKFGKALVACTNKGLCSIEFSNNQQQSLERLSNRYPNADMAEKGHDHIDKAVDFFGSASEINGNLSLNISGTPFQLKVWEALLKIPSGNLSTYGRLAEQIGNSGASRAVGTAVGSNPIAYIIPCHRVIQSTGVLGNYMWGPERKKAMVGMEMLGSGE